MADDPSINKDAADVRIVLVIGPSGAGKSTALNALEDAGFSAVDNLPLSLIDQYIALEVETAKRRIALAVDMRTTGFEKKVVTGLIQNLKSKFMDACQIVYIHAHPSEIIKRYQTTRRHHPLVNAGNLNEAIEIDFAAMDGLDAFADIILDSTDSDPSGFRTILLSRLGLPALNPVPLSISSFSFRKGVPEAVDYVFDTRFLNNPHWQEELRHLTGIDREVQDFVQADIGFQAFMSNVTQIIELVLPALQRTGRPQLGVAFGCTGGHHRSVSSAEYLASWATEKQIKHVLEHLEL
ncbi:MAG: RNase adapter RapZ [Alphaproteobacteria bacterium]|nr:RNase adapter RapZ [Alphaproteobacteria bacterium]